MPRNAQEFAPSALSVEEQSLFSLEKYLIIAVVIAYCLASETPISRDSGLCFIFCKPEIAGL